MLKMRMKEVREVRVGSGRNREVSKWQGQTEEYSSQKPAL